MLKFLKKERDRYVSWEDYKKKVDFLDYFNFQQSVRKENMKLIS